MQEYKVTVSIVCGNTSICFYKPGTEVLHRLDGPAIEGTNGFKSWHQNDKLHRTDGPAVELVDGSKLWYQDDKLHRLDGPAIESANGSVAYWIDGKALTKSQFKKKTAPRAKEMTISEIEAILGHSVKIIK